MNELNIPQSGLTFVKFGAEWCGPCKLLDKTLGEFEKTSEINVIKYDIDEFPEIASQFDIVSVPSVRVYKDGAYIGNFVGAVPPAFIKNVIAGTATLKQ